MNTYQLADEYIKRYIRLKKAESELDEIKSMLLPLVENEIRRKGYTLVKSKRPVFAGVTIETARRLKATKEALDTTLLSRLMNAGRQIAGATYSEYIKVVSTIK